MKAKAEVGIQFGAGGGIKEDEVSQEMMDPGWAITKVLGNISIIIKSDSLPGMQHEQKSLFVLQSQNKEHYCDRAAGPFFAAICLQCSCWNWL